MTIIATIEGQSIEWDGALVSYQGFGRIDDDGSGPAHEDRYHQSQTSLPGLNADVDRYIVVPPQIVRGVGPVVLGAQAFICFGNKTATAVVGDVGPHDRIGEISRALAIELGIDPDPNTGGVDTASLAYQIQPGVAAVVDGKHYRLQAA